MLIRSANLSDDGVYRYRLTRIWDRELPMLYVVMLNPSTADALKDDPTIRKVIHFATAHGYGGICVLNLYALRATDPGELLAHPHPVWPQNMDYISMLYGVDVLLAWGSHKAVGEQGATLAGMLRRHGCSIYCLGTNKDGNPKHPLYLRNDTTMRRLFGAKAA